MDDKILIELIELKASCLRCAKRELIDKEGKTAKSIDGGLAELRWILNFLKKKD